MSAPVPTRIATLAEIRSHIAAALAAADGLEEFLLAALISRAHDVADVLLHSEPVTVEPTEVDGVPTVASPGPPSP